jgi:ABC-type Fe3+-hydroxamate transport system substrate-binding protein
MFLSQINNLYPKRIISLVPSITELLHHLALEEEVIGITKFCIHPTEWYHNKKRVGGTKNIDIELIIDLQPDLIICSKEENIKEQIDNLAEKSTVLLTDVKNYEDALQMIMDIGLITNRQIEATALVNSIAEQFSHNIIEKRNALYLIWKDPYMTIGGDTFINSMMQKAGFTNLYQSSLRYPTLSLEEMINLNPSIILLSSEPYPFKEKHVNELLAVLPSCKIILVDGEMFSWYGSRMKVAVTYFAQLNIDINNL